MANAYPGRSALATALPLSAAAKVSLSKRSSPILASSPLRRRRRRTAVSAVVTDRSRAQASARSGSSRTQACASSDLANAERCAAPSSLPCPRPTRWPATTRSRRAATEIVEDTPACLRNRRRQLLLDDLVAPVALRRRRRPVDPGVTAVRRRGRLLLHVMPDLDAAVAWEGGCRLCLNTAERRRRLLLDAVARRGSSFTRADGGAGSRPRSYRSVSSSICCKNSSSVVATSARRCGCCGGAWPSLRPEEMMISSLTEERRPLRKMARRATAAASRSVVAAACQHEEPRLGHGVEMLVSLRCGRSRSPTLIGAAVDFSDK